MKAVYHSPSGPCDCEVTKSNDDGTVNITRESGKDITGAKIGEETGCVTIQESLSNSGKTNYTPKAKKH